MSGGVTIDWGDLPYFTAAAGAFDMLADLMGSRARGEDRRCDG